MVQEMVITLREGGETSLMLALLFSSLKTAGHFAYRAAAWVGFAVALALSVLAGIFLRDLGALGPLFEATLAWIGAGFIASLAIQLHLNAGDYREQLKQLRDTAAAEQVSWTTAFAIGSFAFVSVIREGLETAVFLANGTGLQSHGSWLGAGVGLTLAAAFGVAIYMGFRRLNIRAFMRTTEILLFALVASLCLTGLSEFSEAGLLPMPRPLELFHLQWIAGGLFLQCLLCAGPFLYVLFVGAPLRHYARAAGIAVLLALIPMSLGAAARRWEHSRLTPADRAAASEMERAARGRTQEMTAALGVLRDRVRQGDPAGARGAWVEARSAFVQAEPFIALANEEAAEGLNGEPGESAGFHGVEATLFERGAPWAADRRARTALAADISDLIALADVASDAVSAMVLDPGTVRAAWSGSRWTLLSRMDGQESAASGTSIVEFGATLDAMDRDLGQEGYYTRPIRAALGPTLAESARGPRFGEHATEIRVAPERLHATIAAEGPDRVWEAIDRESLRRGIEETIRRIEAGPPGASGGGSRGAAVASKVSAAKGR